MLTDVPNVVLAHPPGYFTRSVNRPAPLANVRMYTIVPTDRFGCEVNVTNKEYMWQYDFAERVASVENLKSD